MEEKKEAKTINPEEYIEGLYSDLKTTRYRVLLKGYRMLMNPATEELLDSLEGGSKISKPKDKSLNKRKKAEDKIIRNEAGQIGIPRLYLFSSLKEGGRKIKWDGKSNISTKESSYLPYLMRIVDEFMPFEDQQRHEKTWVPDRRRGRLPDGTAVPIIRPNFSDWSFWVTIEVYEKRIALTKIIDLFAFSGEAVGLGDFRPTCSGDFGTFRIAKWEKDVNGASNDSK